ncbi:MAG: hypothetical protein IT365_03570 [Candidatus Hydrogenedentes bacterium]|nr:hypothetical protein [Candidatus Hydrogenedentota bacterium]
MSISSRFVVVLGFALCSIASGAEDLAFENPPASDRPWVYWFWKNGNISREGITADLEAMERVGIGGAILMEVSLSVPPGKYTFFSGEWRGLFKHAVQEANRLGLSISMNSAPGWTGSGGPWVTPEQSMQKVVFSETPITRPGQIQVALPQPEAVQGFYRDIAVLAFPTPVGAYRIDDISEKAFYRRGPFTSQPAVRATLPSLAEYQDAPTDSVIPLEKIVDITSHMDASGTLTWIAPEGNWTVLRIGHTSTGQTNHPAPLPGLECDKLDIEALDAHFREFITVLLDDVGPEARKALVAVHLDSWEVGAQNWTRRFREDFQKRRGYDLLPYMPVMTGRVVQNLEVSERFLWDLRQTVSEMLVENHGRHLRRLAQEQGLWFSVEPYDMTPCDDMTLGATGDVPMCEFWSNVFDSWYSVKEATSVAHVYGKPVVAAEAFTSIDRWLLHPGAIKAQGDWAFCEGINRFVIHRYIHQPYPSIRPGLSLGPHGLHYERTQTWWEFSRPWHEYIARCQHLLRQGRFVADILYLSPEGAPNVFQGPDPAPKGYKYDACTPEALLTRVSVDNNQLALPSGMRYRLLVLPNAETMTPALLAKVRDLSAAGAVVVGNPPRKSPSLSNYPECDAQVQQIAAAAWATEAGPIGFPEHTAPSVPKDDKRDALAKAHWIWHRESDPATPPPPGKRYFRHEFTLPDAAAIHSGRIVLTADNTFALYVNGSLAKTGDNLNELYPVDVTALLKPGTNVLAVAAENKGNQPNAAGLVGALSVQFDDSEEIAVVTDAGWLTSIDVGESWTRAAAPGTWAAAHDLGLFGVAPWEDVGKKAIRIDPYPDSSGIERLLADMGVLPDFVADADLAYIHRQVGTSDVYFVSNGSQDSIETACTFRVSDKKAELWHPETGRKRTLTHVSSSPDGRTVLQLRFDPAESYFVVFSPVDSNSPKHTESVDFPALKPVMEVSGPWHVSFDPRYGGPDGTATFDELTDWSQHPEDSIRYYSGPADYSTAIEIPAEILNQGRPLYLDLGRVEVAASIRLNGKDLGIVWKRPFRIAIGDAARPGSNDLEVRVVNLWPNRMIGDEHLPQDSERNTNGTLKQWPQWMLENKPSPAGRHTFATWQHWTKDDPLLPSGLLGPVHLLTEE